MKALRKGGHCPPEAEHGYAAGLRNLELKLGHILYHLQEHRVDLTGILAGEAAAMFMRVNGAGGEGEKTET